MVDALIGRIHPLVVHLPIGFILLGFLLESYVLWIKKDGHIRVPVRWTYLLSAIASILAVITGLLLSNTGKFVPDTLSWHKWMAISTMVLAAILYIDKSARFSGSPKRSWGLSLILVLFVSATGHYGGMLTHGNDYLVEKAPGWIQGLAGYDPGTYDFSAVQADSVMVFADLVGPILQRKCGNCHNPSSLDGGLDLMSYKGITDGGKNGPVILAGKALESELIRRVSLPVEDGRFMPPGGKTLSTSEFEIMRYWIEQGADSTLHFESAKLSSELLFLLERDYGLDLSPRPHYEKLKADSIGDHELRALKAAGFEASFLGEHNFFLDIRYTHDTLDREGLSPLEKIAGQVAFLDLSKTIFLDSTLSGLSRFSNLARLDLHHTNVADTALRQLENMNYLKTVNLFQTPVGHDGVQHLFSNPALEKVFIWQTKLSDEEINTLRAKHPGVTLVGGSVLQVFADSTKTRDTE